MLKSSGWSALDDDGDHLAVEVGGGVVGGDQRLELLEPLLASKNLRRSARCCRRCWFDQAELLSRMRGPVRPEAAAVEPDVEQPVVLVVGFLGRASRAGTCRWGRPAPGGSWPPAPPTWSSRSVVTPSSSEERQRVLELPLGVVPEDDPGLLLVEEAVEGVVDLLGVHRCSPVPAHAVGVEGRVRTHDRDCSASAWATISAVEGSLWPGPVGQPDQAVPRAGQRSAGSAKPYWSHARCRGTRS